MQNVFYNNYFSTSSDYTIFLRYFLNVSASDKFHIYIHMTYSKNIVAHKFKIIGCISFLH